MRGERRRDRIDRPAPREGTGDREDGPRHRDPEAPYCPEADPEKPRRPDHPEAERRERRGS